MCYVCSLFCGQIRIPTGLTVPIKSRDVIVDFQKQVRIGFHV